MQILKMLSKYIPLVIGLVILLIIALIAPWDKIEDLLNKVPVSTFMILFGLSVVYYVSKAVRYWYILKLLGIHTPFIATFLLYLSGQSFSLLPAGELYRSVLLHKHLGVSMTKSSPSVTIQGLIEAIVLLSLSLIGAFILGQNRFAVVVIGLLLLLLVIALQRGVLLGRSEYLNKLPYVSVNKRKFNSFLKSHQEILSPSSLFSLIAFSLVPVLSGTSILYVASRAVGFNISFVQSMIGYSLPVVLSGLSFLPGGLGVSEGGTIGMIQLFGASAAAAITITLLVRIFTLVAGLVFGIIAQLLVHINRKTI